MIRQTPTALENGADHSTPFVPRGAIAFLAAMLVGYAAVWFAMYALLAHRA
jgi:hypothetical protein